MEHDKQHHCLSMLLFVLLLSIYILTMSGHHYSVDGIAMYQQSKTLLFQHTFRFSPPFVWGDYRADFVYWPEGLSIVYMIPLAIFSYVIFPANPTFRTIPNNPALLINDPGYLHLSITNSVITALTATILYSIAIRFGFPRKVAILLTIVYGLMSPAFAYQKQDFAQPLAALLITTTILLYLIAYDSNSGQKKYIYLSQASICLGLLLMTRSETQAIVIPLFMVFSLFQLRRSRWRERVITGVALLLPLSLFAALHAGINYIKTGSIFGVQGSAFISIGDSKAFFTALLGLLVSPGRGLLIFFPLALYAPLGLYRMFSQTHARWSGIFLGLIVLHLLLFGLWPLWWGGLSWGPRFLVPILPVLTLLAFWPRAEDRIQSAVRHYVATLAKALVIVIGFVMTLSAVLLRWDAIEGQHGPPPASRLWTTVEMGQWYFRPEANGVWTNWRDLGKIRGYDLLVIQPSMQGVVLRNLIVALSLMLVVVVGMLCLNWLYQKVKRFASFTRV